MANPPYLSRLYTSAAAALFDYIDGIGDLKDVDPD